MREAREQDSGEVVVELRFRKIKLLAFPNKTKFKQNAPWFFYTPRSDTVEDLEKKIKRLLSSYYYNVRKDKTLILTKFRLWKCTLTDSQEDTEKILSWDSKMIYDFSKIAAVACNIIESDKKVKVEDLNFIDGTIFLVEIPKDDGKYTFRPM